LVCFRSGVDFFDRSESIQGFYKSILFEGDHTILNCDFIDDGRACSIDDEFFYIWCDLEDFIDSESSLISYTIAFRASDWFIEEWFCEDFFRNTTGEFFF